MLQKKRVGNSKTSLKHPIHNSHIKCIHIYIYIGTLWDETSDVNHWMSTFMFLQLVLNVLIDLCSSSLIPGRLGNDNSPHVLSAHLTAGWLIPVIFHVFNSLEGHFNPFLWKEMDDKTITTGPNIYSI